MKAAVLLVLVFAAGATSETTSTAAPEQVDLPDSLGRDTDPLADYRTSNASVAVIQIKGIKLNSNCTAIPMVGYVELEQTMYTALTSDTYAIDTADILYIEGSCYDLTTDELALLGSMAAMAITSASAFNIEIIIANEVGGVALAAALEATVFTALIDGTMLSFSVVESTVLPASDLGVDLGNTLPVMRDACEQFRVTDVAEAREFNSGSGSAEAEARAAGASGSAEAEARAAGATTGITTDVTPKKRSKKKKGSKKKKRGRRKKGKATKGAKKEAEALARAAAEVEAEARTAGNITGSGSAELRKVDTIGSGSAELKMVDTTTVVPTTTKGTKADKKAAKKAAKEAAKEAKLAAEAADAVARAADATTGTAAVGKAAKKAAKEAAKEAKVQARQLEKCLVDQATALLRTTSSVSAPAPKKAKKNKSPESAGLNAKWVGDSRSVTFRGVAGVFAGLSMVAMLVGYMRADRQRTGGGGYTLVGQDRYAAAVKVNELARPSVQIRPTEITPILFEEV